MAVEACSGNGDEGLALFRRATTHFLAADYAAALRDTRASLALPGPHHDADYAESFATLLASCADAFPRDMEDYRQAVAYESAGIMGRALTLYNFVQASACEPLAWRGQISSARIKAP